MPNLSVTAERTRACVLCARTSRNVMQWIGERSQGGQVRLLLHKLQRLQYLHTTTRKVCKKNVRQACYCRTTLLVWRQVTHACESQWRYPRLASFIQGQKKEGSHCAQGEEGKRTSWILRATTLGFIYTLDVLLSKLSLSVSVSSNDKALTRHSL